MKQNKALVVEFVIGIILAGVGLGTRIDYYSIMLFAMGFGLAAGSVRQIFHIMYWNSPKHREEYEEKKREAYIDSIDERRQYLRMKAAQASAQIMLVTLLLLAFLLALFRAQAWVIGMVFMLFLVLCVSDIVVFRFLEKRM